MQVFSACVGLWTATLLFFSPALAEEAPTTETLYPSSLIALSSDSHFSQYAFLVDKTARTLRVYQVHDKTIDLIEEHPADIGKNTGDKERANDARTPVGIYFLMTKKTQPEIPFSLYGSRAFTTDYPNIFDQRVAKSGSGIWLHAVPDNVPLTRGSRGCVVVRNNVIQHLEKYIRLGQTPLVITEKAEYVTKADYLDYQKKYLDFFEQWRLAWEKSEADQYIQFYDPTFRNSEMNYKQWYRHKKKLKDLYSFIKVELGPPIILRNKDQVVIRTLQNYQSDLHHDFGEKTLHAHFSPEVGFHIIREDWVPVDPPNVTLASPEPPATGHN